MTKLTEQQFKELISGMTADEMIDMMPKKIVRLPKKYPSTIIHEIYFKQSITRTTIKYHDLVHFMSKDKKSAYTKMLLRLLTSNYLLDYQLITLHNKEENQVNNG